SGREGRNQGTSYRDGSGRGMVQLAGCSIRFRPLGGPQEAPSRNQDETGELLTALLGIHEFASRSHGPIRSRRSLAGSPGPSFLLGRLFLLAHPGTSSIDFPV